MKKLCLYVIVVLLVLSMTGCQYLLPPMIRAGSVSVKKDVEKTIPEHTVPPDIFEIEITPPNSTTQPSSFGETSWYLPEKGRREK